jgi:hypothetical protein
LVCAFFNGIWNFTGFAEPETDATFTVTNDHKGREAESTSALHNFRYARDVNDAILKTIAFWLLVSFSWFSHFLLFFCHETLLDLSLQLLF